MGPVAILADGYGDGGPAAQARLLSNYVDMTFMPDGRLVFVDPYSNSVRRVEASGDVSCLAGCSHVRGFGGDGGAATTARLDQPESAAVAADGRIFIADTGNRRVRSIHPGTGVITTVVGSGIQSAFSAGGTATAVDVRPTDLAIAPDGALLIADSGARPAVRRLVGTTLSTILGGASGTSEQPWDPTGPDRVASAVAINPIGAVAVAADGTVYVASAGQVLARTTGGAARAVAGIGMTNAPSDFGDGGPASAAHLKALSGVVVESSNVIAVATDSGIRRFTIGGQISLVHADVRSGRHLALNGGRFWTAERLTPTGYAMAIRATSPDGTTTAQVGSNPGAVGDGLDISQAWFGEIADTLSMSDGSIYVVDSLNGRVRRVDASGAVSTVAGTVPGATSFSGEGGPAVEAVLPEPTQLARTDNGDVYVACRDASVRVISAADGKIRTVLGTGSPWDAPAPVGPRAGTAMPLNVVGSMSAAPDGSIWILDGQPGIATEQRLLRLKDGTAEQVTGRSAPLSGAEAIGSGWASIASMSSFGIAPDGSARATDWTGAMYLASAAGTITSVQSWWSGSTHIRFGADSSVMLDGVRLFADGSAAVILDAGSVPGVGVGVGFSFTVDRAVFGVQGRLYQRALPAVLLKPVSPVGRIVPSPSGWGLALQVTSPAPSAAGLGVSVRQRPGSANVARNFRDGIEIDPYSGHFRVAPDPASPDGTPLTMTAWTYDSVHQVYSAPSSWTLVNYVPLTCSLTPATKSVAFGTSVFAVGTVKYTNTTQMRPGTPGTWTVTRAGSAPTTEVAMKTGAAGETSYNVEVRRRTTLTYSVAAVPGIGGCQASVTYTVPTAVAASLSRKKVARKGAFTVRATLAPKVAGEPMSVQRLSGSRWITVKTSTTPATGAVSFALKAAKKKGVYKFRVAKPTSLGFPASTSAVLKLTVR
jgi:sugar lactone lactonase YvrE